MCRVAEIAAGAGVHRSDKHKVGRIGDFALRAREGNLTIFERLTEGFDNISGKFGDLVEEKDTEMCEGNLAGEKVLAAAEHSRET